MLDLSWSEILVIAIVLIVVVGPKDLPRLLRSFGRTTTKMRKMAGDFRKQFDEALKEAEMEDLKSLAEDARKLNPASEIRRALNPMEQAAKDVRAGLDGALKTTKSTSSQPASSEPRAAAPLKAGAVAQPGDAKAGSVAKPVAAKPATGSTAKTGSSVKKPATASSTAKTKPTSAKPRAAAKPAAAKASVSRAKKPAKTADGDKT